MVKCAFLLFLLTKIAVTEYSEAPQYEDVFDFVDTFDEADGGDQFLKKWFHSTTKDDVDSSLVYQGKFVVGPEQENLTNNVLLMNNSANFKKFGIFRLLNQPFYFKDNFILQYELTFQNDHKCGGAYLKLISKDSGLSDTNTNLNSETPYTIMFGPDVCDNNYKFHFIFRHKNPITGEIEEKHMKQPDPSTYKHIFSDGKVHLLRLMTYKWGQRFVVELDNYIIAKGGLLTGFEPAVNPDEYVDDPNHTKPSDWDDRTHIEDPDDIKPDDWDESQPAQIEDPDAVIPEYWLENEPKYVDDTSAEKPAEWDDSIDGHWVPPKIPNPLCVNDNCGVWERPLIENSKYKGIFKPKMIKNPNYKGEFNPRKIPNPKFFSDKNPFEMTPIEAVAIEVVASPNVVTFDNIIITNRADALIVFNSKHWRPKNPFDAVAIFGKYKYFVAVGAVVASLIIFVYIVSLYYTKRDESTVEPLSSPEELKDEQETEPHLSEEHMEAVRDDEAPSKDSVQNESEEEEPPIALRRSTRRTKKNNA